MKCLKLTTLNLLLAATLTLSSCAPRVSTVTNLPTGVTQTQVQKWDVAVADLQKIAAANTTLRQTVISLNAQGVIPDGNTYVTMLMAIAKIDQAQVTAANFLQTVPNNWGQSTQATINGYMQQISIAAQSLVNMGAVGIKNSNSQTQVNNLITEITSLTSLIISLS